MKARLIAKPFANDERNSAWGKTLGKKTLGTLLTR